VGGGTSDGGAGTNVGSGVGENVGASVAHALHTVPAPRKTSSSMQPVASVSVQFNDVQQAPYAADRATMATIVATSSTSAR